MKNNKFVYICNECQIQCPRWLGQCPNCKSWNTLQEIQQNAKINKKSINNGYSGCSQEKAVNPSQISANEHTRFITGIGEFDRVMGGGITIGSATLFTGGCGAGKTTLLTKLCALISKNKVVLYATGEENNQQWLNRQKRVAPDYNNNNLFIYPSGNLEDILSEAKRVKAEILIVDSIQATTSNTIEGGRGSVSQVKECGSKITEFSKINNVTSIMIGQVTKDNTVAGPKVLEHTIDTHIHLEKSEHNSLRTLRAMKNRFGSEETVGLFKMEGRGMIEISDPSQEFRSSSDKKTSGCSITCVRSANRNMLVEIQSLVVESQSDKLQRVCLGVNFNRIQLITAILRKHCAQNFYADIFITVVGGLKLPEQDTSSDLAIAAALLSSKLDKIIDQKTCFIGELTLAGEVKNVPNGDSRAEEATRHGYERIFVSNELYEQVLNTHIKEKLIAIKNIKGLMHEFR